MSQNLAQNMAVMHHWINTVNENDAAKMIKELAAIITEDYCLHDPSTPDLKPGAAEYLKLFEQQMTAVADRKVTIEDMFAVEDKVVSRGIYEFRDLATQERNKVTFMVISRFEGGKLKEEWQMLAPVAASP